MTTKNYVGRGLVHFDFGTSRLLAYSLENGCHCLTFSSYHNSYGPIHQEVKFFSWDLQNIFVVLS